MRPRLPLRLSCLPADAQSETDQENPAIGEADREGVPGVAKNRTVRATGRGKGGGWAKPRFACPVQPMTLMEEPNVARQPGGTGDEKKDQGTDFRAPHPGEVCRETSNGSDSCRGRTRSTSPTRRWEATQPPWILPRCGRHRANLAIFPEKSTHATRKGWMVGYPPSRGKQSCEVLQSALSVLWSSMELLLTRL